MIAVKVPSLKSWFDPLSVPFLSFNLAERIKNRMGGRRGLFITLTYRHDDYESPRELYYQMKEQQHVPLFIRRLSRYLGESLTGKWMRKLEFQEGGWVHFHLIIDYSGFIPQSDLQALWGHGFVWVNRWKDSIAGYVTKYVAKDGKVPAWILAEKPKTVKIVAVSPGFWEEENEKEKYDKKIPDPWGKSGCYIPIAVRLEEYRNKTLCREGVTDPSFFTVNVHIGFLLKACMENNVNVIGSEKGWMHLDVDRDHLCCFAGLAAADAAALHLINKRKPDFMPDWVRAILEETLDEERYRTCPVSNYESYFDESGEQYGI